MPSQSPAGWVRNVVKRIVKTTANAASAHAHASQPTLRDRAARSLARGVGMRQPDEEERADHEDR